MCAPRATHTHPHLLDTFPRVCADPHEEEILFAPLTGLEVHGFRVEGSVLVVEAKMSVNLNVRDHERCLHTRCGPRDQATLSRHRR